VVFGIVFEVFVLLLTWLYLLSFMITTDIVVHQSILIIIPLTVYMLKFFISLLFVNFLYLKKK